MTDGKPLDPPYAPGAVLANRYRVIAKLGEGGMGLVLKATQIDLDRVVALKLLLPEFRFDQMVCERFLREAKAAARVHGDHVARILDVGKLENGEPYIAMEFLEGEDLGKVLERQGRLSVDVATSYMLRACAAVAEAHAVRIVHRDLKPQNLFLAKSPNGDTTLKVLDFGISRVDDAASHLTQTASALGTAFYMAPEQITSPKMIDLRADIWSLGVVYYELLTGKTPFDGETLPQVVAHVIKNERPRARDVVPDLPAAVDAVIERCLAPEPGARFQTAVDLASALAAIGRHEEDVAMVKRLKSLPPPPPSITNEASALPSRPRQSSVVETELPEMPEIPDLELDVKKAPNASGSRSPAFAATVPQLPQAPSGGRNFAFDGGAAAPKLELDRPQGPPSRSQKIEIDRSAIDEARRVHNVKLRRQGLVDEEDEAPRRGPWRAIAITLVVLALPPLAVFVVAPRVLAARIDSAAAHAGMTITHDPPSISLTGIELRNLHVTFDNTKDAEFTARSAHAGFAGDGISLRDVQAKSTTPISALTQSLAAVNDAIPWAVEAEGVHLEYAWSPTVTMTCDGKFSSRLAESSRNVWLECADARVKTSRGEFGPFTLSADRTHGLWGGSLAIPDAAAQGVVPTASIVSSDTGMQFNADVPHVSLAKLHIAPPMLGLPEKDAADVDLKIEARRTADGKWAGTGAFALHDAMIGASKMDATWDFEIASHDADLVLLTKTAKIGPFPTQINASLKDEAKLTFRASYPCAEIARSRHTHSRAAGTAMLPTIGGIANESGEVKLAGTYAFNPDEFSLDPRAEKGQDAADTCGLLIFPRKL